MRPPSEDTQRPPLAVSAGKIGAATTVSRLAGFAREVLMAAVFGTGLAADAFYAAFRVPSSLRQLFAEGAMSASFVPVYTERLTVQSQESADRLASNLLVALGVVLTALCGLAIWLAPQYMSLFVYGWRDDPERFGLAVKLTRVLFPYLLAISFAAVVMGVLNSHRRFGVPALTPVLLNAVWIVGIAVAVVFGPPDPKSRIIIVAGAILLGGAGQFLMQLPSAHSVGFRFRPSLSDRLAGVRRVALLMIPGVFGLAVVEVNFLVDTFFASRLPGGSLSALQYGNRLMLLPVGVFAVAVATASLPELSRAAARNDRASWSSGVSSSLRLILSAMVPAAAFFIALAVPVVVVLFQRGAFTAAHSAPMTAGALLFYAIGLPFYGSVKGLVQGFYAHQDTRTPVLCAAVAMIVNVVLNVLLIGPMQHRGLALATALSSGVNIALLVYLLGRRIGPFEQRRILSTFARLVVSAAVAGGTAHLISRVVGEQLAAGWWSSAAVLGCGTLAFGAVFLIMIRATRVEEPFEAVRVILGRLGRSR